MAIKEKARTVRHWPHPELTGVVKRTGRLHHPPQ